MEVGQVDVISGCSAVTLSNRQSSPMQQSKKGHLRGTCRHAYRNPTRENLFM